MGGLSIVWYVGLTIVSENILFDSIAALGLMIAFYYGMTGFACTIYYRRQLFRSAKCFLLLGVGPTTGGLILAYVFVRSCWTSPSRRTRSPGDSWFGVGPAADHRPRLPAHGRGADVAVGAAAPGILPPQARGRRPAAARAAGRGIARGKRPPSSATAARGILMAWLAHA